jgi:hypothetical protein
MKFVNPFTKYILLVVCLTASLVAAACGSTSPTSPSPSPSPSPAPAPAPAPAPSPSPAPAPAPTPGRLAIEVTPNPVPYSGQAVEGCSSTHTWIYDQILRNTGGTRLTLTRRRNYFDEGLRSEPTVNISIEPGQSTSVTTRWCSNTNAQHTARTDWFGTDSANNSVDLTGPTVTLRPR